MCIFNTNWYLLMHYYYYDDDDDDDDTTIQYTTNWYIHCYDDDTIHDSLV